MKTKKSVVFLGARARQAFVFDCVAKHESDEIVHHSVLLCACCVPSCAVSPDPCLGIQHPNRPNPFLVSFGVKSKGSSGTGFDVGMVDVQEGTYTKLLECGSVEFTFV